MRAPFISVLVIVLLSAGSAAFAQTTPLPTPPPLLASPAPPVASPEVPVASPPAEPPPPAGIVPSAMTLDVSGAPAADPSFLDTQIRQALDRAIRPTLRPGASIAFGPIVPWPLPPLALNARSAVNVTVTLGGDPANAPVSGVTTVTLENVPVVPADPAVLFLSDDPEYLLTEGLVFSGSVSADRAARLYYYHSDIGVPRDLDVVLTATVASRVQVIASEAGPDLDVLSVGHTVTRDLLRLRQSNEGAVVDVVPGRPFVVRHALVLQGEVAAGALDLHVLGGGAVGVSVVASAAGGRPEAYLAGPRVPFDGHNRHGVFDLSAFGAIAATYTADGPDVAVKYGDRSATPRNVDPSDPGHDYGDYGVVHRITFTLLNPTDAARNVYLYEKPLGGPVRSTFVVDGQFREIGCVRLPQPYWVTTYQLPAHSSGASTTVTMTDGGSFYPIEYGVTETPPSPYTPPVGSPEGCSPIVPSLTGAR